MNKKLKNLNLIKHEKHSFYIIETSFWPFSFSIVLFNFLMFIYIFLKKFYLQINFLYYIFLLIFFWINIYLFLYFLNIWIQSIILESSFAGNYTRKTKQGIKYGVVLFIISEIAFFFALFWIFFHFNFIANIFIGTIFIPFGLKTLNPYYLPLINTFILIYSSISLTYSHLNLIINNNFDKGIKYLIQTLCLAFLFFFLQIIEYIILNFSIQNTIYGSLFFFITGFHGLHIIIGFYFLCINLIRFWNISITINQHVSFESAIWYWHFIDIIWLFIFIFIYWWNY